MSLVSYKKLRKRVSRPAFFIPIFVLLLATGLISAKVLYNKLREPDFYQLSENVIYTTPQQKLPVGVAVVPKVPPSKALLPSAKWVAQTFNNCGPATTSMVLQYFGYTVGQDVTKAHLRTNSDDKNVFTQEIADYLKSDYGISSKLLYGGNVTLLKKLVANGFYVVVEDWLHPNEDIGHTTIIRGYDDSQGVFIADDSFIGVNITYPYEEFDKTQWKPFNREYLPVYKPESEELLKSIIGPSWDKMAMYEHAALVANSEIAENEKDMYAWFNLGTSNFGLGNYEEARAAFEKSRSLGWPKRMLWYQIQPIETYNALGEYSKALELSRIGLSGNDSFAELHLESAIAYKGLGDREKAREEGQRALFYYPNFEKAKVFMSSL